MNTRMSKYYNETVEGNKRSVRNRNLYEKIYDEVEYSNIEGIATIEKTNEIDLNKIKQLLMEKEGKKVERKFEDLPKKREISEEKVYDIRDVLSKAKETRPIDNKNRSLSDEKLEILRSIARNEDFDKHDSNELKELIHTITNTSVLNKMGDSELVSDMFSDLIGSGHTIHEELPVTVSESSISESSIDESFYTSSLNFAKEDFEKLEDSEEEDKGSSVFIKILTWILFTAIGLSFIYIAIKFPIV